MTYSFNRGHEELVAHDGEGEEQVNGDESMEDDGAMLSLQLREQTRREVIDGRRGAVAEVDLWN